MTYRSHPATSRSQRRPLIKAIQGMLAVSFLGGCRLGNPDPGPGPSAGGAGGGGSMGGSDAGMQDGGVADAADGG